VCVVAERPETVDTVMFPQGFHEQVRLGAVRYRDGWRPQLA
jgi:hypothetical protein